MELEDIKKTEWYQSRPEIIQQAICQMPPNKTYRFKDSKKECFITSLEEPKSGKFEDITCTVQKTGKGGVMDEMGFGALDTNAVFGVSINDLEEIPQS